MLELSEVSAFHGPVEAVREVTLHAAAGRVTAVVGPNGAGKSTLARTIAGLHRVRTGTIRLDGNDLSQASAVEAARSGIALVPQGRRLFPSLTVAEHLSLARRHRRAGATTPAEVLELFPNLARRLKVRARALSGGEQQMLAIGRAVLIGPLVLVLDEPTEGLAPTVVELVSGLITHLTEKGVAVLLFEQAGAFPAEIADDVATMARGVLRENSNTEVSA
jgi:branched-chain amino acid transport system ATP-binding protein